MELRCLNGIMFGKLDLGYIEVKCRSSRCGAVPGDVVVIHRFDAQTGKLVETQRFRDPRALENGRREHAAQHDPAAVRSA